MWTFRLSVSAGLLASLIAQPAFALQDLCTVSPENPTVILALVGAAVGGGQRASRWLRSRRANAGKNAHHG